jgi:CheY-like chemotaxis protein
MEDFCILIVDDDPGTLHLMKSILAAAGLRVECAGDGEKALLLLASRRFRLLVTDLQMPGLSGLELAEKAKKLDPGLQVVLTTAGTPPPQGHLTAAGISNVLSKPFKLKSLLALVRPGG